MDFNTASIWQQKHVALHNKHAEKAKGRARVLGVEWSPDSICPVAMEQSKYLQSAYCVSGSGASLLGMKHLCGQGACPVLISLLPQSPPNVAQPPEGREATVGSYLPLSAVTGASWWLRPMSHLKEPRTRGGSEVYLLGRKLES